MMICRARIQLFTPRMLKTCSRSFSRTIFATATGRGGSLAIRKLIFRHDPLDLIGPDAVSEPSVCLDRHTLNDGVNLRLFNLHASLRPLTAMKDGFVDLINMCHFSIPLDRWATN